MGWRVSWGLVPLSATSQPRRTWEFEWCAQWCAQFRHARCSLSPLESFNSLYLNNLYIHDDDDDDDDRPLIAHFDDDDHGFVGRRSLLPSSYQI